MTGTDPEICPSITVGDVLDMGAPEPPNVIGVESMAWADFGWGDGATLIDKQEADDPEAELLHFGKTRAPSIDGHWKFYLGGKTYTDWETVLRRFGPVRVTQTSNETTDGGEASVLACGSCGVTGAVIASTGHDVDCPQRTTTDGGAK